MSTPSDKHRATWAQANTFERDESSLLETLRLVERSLGGPQALLVLPDEDGHSRILGDEDLDLSAACRERLVAAIEGSNLQVNFEGKPHGTSSIISDLIIFDSDEPRIRWIATGLSQGGALVACDEGSWEPDERDQAILLGFAQLFERQHLRESQPGDDEGERLRDLIAESARDGIIGVDTDARCRYINQTGADLVGLDPDDVISMPVDQLFKLPELEQSRKIFAFENADAAEYHDVSLIRPDGTTLPVDLTVVPSVEQSGDVSGAVVRFWDMREQKAAAAAVEQSEARHQAFLETTLDSIITIDPAGIIREFNHSAEIAFRCSASEVVGQPLSETLISPAWREWWDDAFKTFSESGGGPLNTRRVQIAGRRPDGSSFPADFTLTRIPTQDNWLYTLYIHDLTEQQDNEQRREARYAVTHILAETRSPRDALPDVLEALCTGLHWDWAACWTRAPGSTEMALDLTWHSDSVEPHALEIVARENGFEPGYGFLGDVWSRRTADWIEDLTQPNPYRRAEAALACGFRSVTAMPIIGRTEIIGIIEFHSREQRERDPEMLRMLYSLGSQIGQYTEPNKVV
jgi:PAS domain S-box-containing protein